MSVLDDIERFQREVIGKERPTKIAFPDWETMRQLRNQENEEHCELSDAILAHDMAGLCDACCDIFYTVGQIAYRCGVDLRPIWDEVTRSNMAKKGGEFVNGKLQKPVGWTPPDVEGELRKQGYKP